VRATARSNATGPARQPVAIHTAGQCTLKETTMFKLPRPPNEEDLFHFLWCVLSAGGACDAWGGAEQQRVYSEWVAAGRPVGIAEFILARVNEPAPAPKPS
jgi:hypothetical protein